VAALAACSDAIDGGNRRDGGGDGYVDCLFASDQRYRISWNHP